MNLVMDGPTVSPRVPEGNWAGTDWQTGGPIEIVAIPVMVSEESWMKGYGND